MASSIIFSVNKDAGAWPVNIGSIGSDEMTQLQSLDLSGTWKLSWTEGMHGYTDSFRLPARDPLRYLDVPVPGELHDVFEKKGMIGDVNLGINSLSSRWVEEQYYIYRKSFTAPDAAVIETAWLAFNQLDLNAIICLNGTEIGTHSNAHYPCVIDITGKLKQGENELSILIESGLYGVADKPGSDYNSNTDSRLTKRHWLRKPQYETGWDWNPRLLNVGVTGPVKLLYGASCRIDQTTIAAVPCSDFSTAAISARVHLINAQTADKNLTLSLGIDGVTVRRQVTIPAGKSTQVIETELPKPRLWWPAGHGEQNLYQAEISIEQGDTVLDKKSIRFGIRTVTIDQSPHPKEGRYFILTVNGRKIFCKGGNWVPADLIPSRVSDERIRALIDLAVQSHMNILRIWGGGLYADHRILSLCDERGLLVWHDLLFACSKYPADDPAFLADVTREITWAVREYASHPSVAVWCGNNEIETAYWGWGYLNWGRTMPDMGLYHLVIPRILKAENPETPYWPSSPYSPDSLPPYSPVAGDQHPWDVFLGPLGPDFWHYRAYVDRFPTEGGILGASSPATLKQAFGSSYAFRSFAWDHHDNCLNFWQDKHGINYQAVEFWLGRHPEEMKLEDYLFASGLIQAEGLTEYITNYRRRMFSSASAIFWMFNDSWPTTHSWTTFDYYLRKKLSFHPVRRAFNPVSVVVAEEGDAILVFGVNDTPSVWHGMIEYGLFITTGGLPMQEKKEITLAANASTEIGRIDRSLLVKTGGNKTGAFARLLSGDNLISQHRLFIQRFKDLILEKPVISIKANKGKAVFSCPAFAWGVVLDFDGETDCPDNCFDLIPGLPYPVTWNQDAGDPIILANGNSLISFAKQ